MKKNQSFFILFYTFLLIFSCSKDNNPIKNMQFLGVIEWSKNFGGLLNDKANSVIETEDGNIVVLGTTSSIEGDIIDKTLPENDFWLIKIDGNGSILWSKTYGGSKDDVGQQVIQTKNGGFAIVGYSRSDDGDATVNKGFHDNWLLILDQAGNIIWEKSYGFSGHDHAHSILQTNDGGFFMTGFLDVSSSGGEGNSKIQNSFHGVGEFWCHRLDKNGNIIWRRYFGGSNNDRAYSAIQSNNGDFIVTGFSESKDFNISNSKGSYDYWVIKISASGELIWEKSFGGSEIDQARSIVKTDDNSYLIAGNSLSTDGDITKNYGSSDFFIVKIDDNGTLIWNKNYGGSDFDYATTIKKASKGYIISGYSKSSDNQLNLNYGDNDFWILKINDNGNIQWQKTLGGSNLDLAHDIIELENGKIIVVGETNSYDYDVHDNKGANDMLVIKIK